jgi:hypothetical protein
VIPERDREEIAMEGGMWVSASMTRWAARVLSAAILLFWGYFLVAELSGDAGRGDRPLVISDYVILATLIVSLVGLAVAWKWELAGATITLGALAICAAVNWRVLVFPGTLLPIAALLFLFSWWQRRACHDARLGRRAAN